MTFPRTVCQHTTHGADRTLTFEDGIEAAAKIMDEAAARHDKIANDYLKRGRDSDYDHAARHEDSRQVRLHYAALIRALSHKEPSK